MKRPSNKTIHLALEALGARMLRIIYRVGSMGTAGEPFVRLSVETEIKAGDLVRQHVLPDGSVLIRKEKA